MAKSDLERELAFQIRAVGLPEPEREARFHPVRRWRADFLWREPYMILVEVHGGTWQMGRHSRGAGFRNDAEKENSATLMGYRVFKFTTGMVKEGAAIQTLERAFKEEGCQLPPAKAGWLVPGSTEECLENC